MARPHLGRQPDSAFAVSQVPAVTPHPPIRLVEPAVPSLKKADRIVAVLFAH